MPKKLEGYRSGHGRHYNPYCDHYLPLKAVPTNQGLYLFYTTYSFCTIFLVNFILSSENLLHKPPIFIFVTPSSRLIFTTQFCNSLLPPFATCHFMTNPSCNSTTDGWTVPKPQHHLPSIPSLTLTKKQIFFKELSLLPGPTL